MEDVFGFAVKKLPSPPNANDKRRKYVIGALTEYLHSQQQHGLPLHLGAGALLFTLLEEQKSYYQLQLLVQYNLVPDSMDLAYRLLALEEVFPPSAELAMDMLKRLGPLGGDALMGRLLERGQLLPACRFIRSHGNSHGLRSYPARPLLAAAAKRKDSVFAAVFHFFRQRNEAWHNTIHFRPEEQCDEFVQLWQESYGDQVEVDDGMGEAAAPSTPMSGVIDAADYPDMFGGGETETQPAAEVEAEAAEAPAAAEEEAAAEDGAVASAAPAAED